MALVELHDQAAAIAVAVGLAQAAAQSTRVRLRLYALQSAAVAVAIASDPLHSVPGLAMVIAAVTAAITLGLKSGLLPWLLSPIAQSSAGGASGAGRTTLRVALAGTVVLIVGYAQPIADRMANDATWLSLALIGVGLLIAADDARPVARVVGLLTVENGLWLAPAWRHVGLHLLPLQLAPMLAIAGLVLVLRRRDLREAIATVEAGADDESTA